eukprot:2050891-Alexandrium_andersonii.AAC.1
MDVTCSPAGPSRRVAGGTLGVASGPARSARADMAGSASTDSAVNVRSSPDRRPASCPAAR